MQEVQFTPKQIERFWRKVDRLTDDECWPWRASCFYTGYGRFTIGEQSLYAHRVSWMLAHERPIPDGLCVCHRCDNPRCVNPRHLWLGTMAQNMADRDAKGRHRTAPRRKLNAELVVEMRRQHARGELIIPEFSRVHDVSFYAIYAALRRKTWKHVREH
jgi:hypothetical protein